MAGSWGTLAVLTEVTIKVLPARRGRELTLLLFGLDDARAGEAMRTAMNTAVEVSAAAHLPANLAARIEVADAGKNVTALRLEGVPPSIAYRRDKLTEVLKPFGAVAPLDAEDSRLLWRAVRDAAPFADETTRAVWRISVPPTEGPTAGTALATLGADVFYDWAGGLIWAEMPDDQPREAEVRGAVGGKGHAMLVRASVAARASAASFAPLEPGVAALVKRLKESFDPRGVLNPGRMYAGM